MEWNYDDKPTTAGWYAALVCYDLQEGIFPEGAWWDGNTWEHTHVVAFGSIHPTQEEAKTTAYEHDLGA